MDYTLMLLLVLFIAGTSAMHSGLPLYDDGKDVGKDDGKDDGKDVGKDVGKDYGKDYVGRCAVNLRGYNWMHFAHRP